LITLRGRTWASKRGHGGLAASAAAYEQIHPNVRVEWEQLGFDELFYDSRRQFESGSVDFDLMMLDHPWVGEYAVNGWLVDMEALLTSEQRRDLEADADRSSLKAYRYEGRLWSLPTDGACQILAFRPDLVGMAVDQLPGDWDSFLALGESLHEPPDRCAYTHQFGGPNHFLTLLGIAAALGDNPYTEPSRGIDRDAGTRGLDILRRVWELSIESQVESPDKLEHRTFPLMMAEDRAAMCPGVFAYITYYGGEGERQLGIADMPVMPETGKRTSLLGGMGLAIASASPQRDAAWEYATFVMSREVQGGVFVENGGQPGRVSALTSGYANDACAGFGPVLAAALDDCYVRPTPPGWHRAERAGGDVVSRFLSGEIAAQETLAELDRVIGAILKSGTSV
jgi:multiple sugar transport system substrate-binding protein